MPVEWLSFDWSLISSHLVKVVGAFILALPIAWERERATRIMGLRTFPLVAVGSCGFVLVAVAVVGWDADAQARIIQGLITGMGFIGGGAILKEDDGVHGTATAASIWSTGVVGAAVAYGRLEIAVVIVLIVLVVLRFFTPLKSRIGHRSDVDG
ncbi:MAG: MgtC/SapB family protein [Ardenticatenaceae bacterium]